MTELIRASGGRARVKAMLLALCCWAALSASAAVDLRVTGTNTPNPAITGSNLVYTLAVTNIGSTAATGVSITNVLSGQVAFQSVSTTRGSCTNVSGVIRCTWGNVSANAGGRVTITVRPNAPGAITNSVSAGANEADANTANNALTQLTTAVNRRTFLNGDFIQLDDVLANVGTPYPSTINVSGLTAAVHKVTVTLNNVSHNFPDDLDIMLVGPRGQHLMLMSDALTDLALTDIILTFDDAAAEPVPNTNVITSGSFQPVNYGSIADLMPDPAPPGPHFLSFTPLSIFNGTDPNGDWQLFVYDDEPEWGGWIDGWRLAISTLEPIANVGVSLADTPDPTVPGTTITYTATITNAGPAEAIGVWVTNQAPAGLEVLSYSSSRGFCTNAGATIFCDLGAMAAQTSEQLVVRARAVSGAFTNRVEVRGARLDPEPENNAAEAATVVEPRCDLGLGMMSSRNPALLEQPLIYTIAVTNFGPDIATGVRVVDQLPPGVLLVNSSTTQGSCNHQAGVVTCNLGTMDSQARATILLTCRPTVLGPITNVVSVTGDQGDDNPANNAAQDLNVVDPAADLQLTMTDTPDPVPIAQPFTYFIFLTNRGPSVASNIVISDVLPASLRLVSVQSTHGACTNQGNSIGCVIDQLPTGERPVVTIVVTPNNSGTVGNTATVSSQPGDPSGGNNTAFASTLVTPVADLSVSKAADRPLIWQGDPLAYSLVVSNAGPSTATDARLNDVLPPGMSLISAIASVGSCSFQGASVVCTFGNLAPGVFAIVTIVGAAGTAGTITNAANVFAVEQDLNPADNTAVVLTTVIPRTATFSDSTPVTIPELGRAATYPLTINVSGLTAAVQRVRVTLSNLSHTYPDDLDMLLVGPSGQTLAVLSDAGGSAGISNVTLTLDDIAIALLPDSGVLSGGFFKPADYEAFPNEFLAPAPAGPYGAAFETFAGTDPNGAWKLYIVDDVTKDGGSLGGWSLDFLTRDPIADVAVSAQALPELVAVGSNLTLAVTVSNRGPALATAVALTNVYGPDLVFSSVNATQGSCTNEGGLVHCQLGDLASGSTALVQISFTVMTNGTGTNLVTVGARELDLDPANNAAAILHTAGNAPVILTQPVDQYVPPGGTATFSAVASGDPPLTYQWFHGQTMVPDATNTTLVLSNVQLDELLGEYRLLVTNQVGSVLSAAAYLNFTQPPVIQTIPDQLMGEDEVLTVPLVVFDLDTFETFQLSATCDDTNLVPITNLTITGAGTNYALVIAPGTNLFGTNIVTVTATDSGGLASSRAFTLGVQSINDYPHFVAPVGDQVMDEDGVIELPFIIGDLETIHTSLVVGHRSYNQILVPNGGIWFGGVTSNRYIHIPSAPNQSGTAVIEIRVRDEALFRTTNLFTLTVLPVEDSPAISSLADTSIPEDGAFEIAFTIDDAETAPENLRLRAEASNTNLFASDFIFDGIPTANARKIIGRPLPDQFGTSTITVFVEDEAGRSVSNAFEVTVGPVNDPPSVSAIPGVVTVLDQASEPIDFTVGDAETEAGSLTLTGISTNTALLPSEGIEFGGAGSNRTVRVVPAAGQFGWTVARLEVTDGNGGLSVREFEVTVHQSNGPPVIALQPQHQLVPSGAPISLRVVATGPGPLSYQWQRNGEDLPNQTTPIIAIPSVAGTNSGMYRVVVTNGEGSVTSAGARLLVLEATRIVSLTRSGDTAEITFTTAADHQYYVEYLDNLGPEPWTALPGVDGTGEPISVTDPSAPATQRFYRIRVEPAPLP